MAALCPFEDWAGGGGLAEASEHHRQVVDADHQLLTIRSVGFLVDAHSPFEQWPGGCCPPEIVEVGGQVAQRDGDLWMPLAEDGLIQAEGLLEQWQRGDRLTVSQQLLPFRDVK